VAEWELVVPNLQADEDGLALLGSLHPALAPASPTALMIGLRLLFGAPLPSPPCPPDRAPDRAPDALIAAMMGDFAVTTADFVVADDTTRYLFRPRVWRTSWRPPRQFATANANRQTASAPVKHCATSCGLPRTSPPAP
jgi:hypothetical protein